MFVGKTDKDGYGQQYDPATKRTRRAHRFAYEQHHGVTLTKDQIIRHACDNPPCINVDHLSVGTHADNTRDKVERGRQCRGSGIGLSVLKEEDITPIRARIATGESMQTIANDYGVSHTAISRIKRGITWRHI